MRREVRERIGETQGLAVNCIERMPAPTRSELQEMIRRHARSWTAQRTYADPDGGAAACSANWSQTIKQLEFRLRREFAADDEGEIFLYQSGDVPEEYRALVEEYYRALSRSRGNDGR